MVKPKADDAPSWQRVRQAGENVLKKNNAEALTWGQFKSKLATALKVDVVVLKLHRKPLQELIAQYTADTEEEDSSSDVENQDEENQDEEQDSEAMTAMRAMVRAMNLG